MLPHLIKRKNMPPSASPHKKIRFNEFFGFYHIGFTSSPLYLKDSLIASGISTLLLLLGIAISSPFTATTEFTPASW